jgi:predicted transposase YdaD
MPKFRKEESELETIIDKWLYAIKNLYRLQDKPAALTEGIFNKLFEVAEIAAFSKNERYDYEENLKNFLDWFNIMRTAKNEGLAEGREIGIEAGRIEGRAEGELAMLSKLVLAKKKKGNTVTEIADMLEIDIKVVEEILNGKSVI